MPVVSPVRAPTALTAASYPSRDGTISIWGDLSWLLSAIISV